MAKPLQGREMSAVTISVSVPAWYWLTTAAYNVINVTVITDIIICYNHRNDNTALHYIIFYV